MGRCLDWEAINSRGTASGIVVFWDNKVLQLMDVEVGTFLVSCSLRIARMTCVGVSQGCMVLC